MPRIIDNETQERIYDFILAYCVTHLAPPSQTEIMRGAKCSQGDVEKYQRLLLKAGRLRKTPRGQYVPANYRLVNERHLHINETGLTDLAALAIAADWFEKGNLSRGLSPDDILEMLCNASERKISKDGAARFRAPAYRVQNFIDVLTWYADEDNWKEGAVTTKRGNISVMTNAEIDDGDLAREALALLDKA